MIHLSYHPAFDAYHCIFRILRIRVRGNLTTIEVDKLRLVDYFLLFPWRAATIRLGPSDRSIRTMARKLEEHQDYATLPSGETLLERMKPSQTAALQTMAQDGVIDAEGLRNDVVQFAPFDLPPALVERLHTRNSEQDDRMKIVDTLLSYPLLGPNGLKHRTSLLEYRYDKV